MGGWAIRLASAVLFGLFFLPMDNALAQNANPPAVPSAKATATPTPDPNAQKVEVVATPQAKATAAPKAADPTLRLVSLGETLKTIALQTGFKLSELAAKNRLTRSSLLIYGQKIQLPKAAGKLFFVYEAQPGDTVSLIAARFNVSPYAIRKANALACANCVFVRQLVKVPQPASLGGQTVAAPAQITSTTSAPQPFAAIDVSPPQPHAGDVVVVRMTATTPLSNVTGSFAGRPLRFVPAGDTAGRSFIALSGVGVLDEPGIKVASVRAFTASSTPEEVSGQVMVPTYSYGFETVTVTKTLVGLLDAKVNQQELDDFAKIYSQWSSGQFWDKPFTLPVSGTRVTSYFGARRSYNGGLLFGYHSGMDVSTSVGTPVRAMAPGRVVAVQTFPVRGNVVVIDHGRGVMTTYCHLSQWKAKVGDFVKQGDVVALSGNTGRSEGPHVHFELAVGGITVDPRDWLSKALP